MYRGLIIIFILLSCCDHTKNNCCIGGLSLVAADSIPLYNDSLAFQFFDIQQIEKGLVLGFNYPLLDLSVIKTREPIAEISQAGNAPSEFKGFIESTILEDGTVLVLQQDNHSKIVVFDNNYRFQGNINLTDEIKGYFPAPFESHFQATYISEDQYKVYFSLNSTNFTRYDAEYYRGYSIVEMDIDVKSLKILDKKLILPFDSFAEIKTALDKNRKTWKTPTPYLKVSNDTIAVYYDFLQQVLLYDSHWNLLQTYQVNFQYPDFEQYTSLSFDYNTENRITKEEQLKYTNYNLCSIDFDGSLVYLVYFKPVGTNSIPKTFNELTQNYQPEKILHILNLKTGTEYSTKLPKHLFPYRINAVSQDSIYFVGDSKIREDLYGYRYKLKVKEDA